MSSAEARMDSRQIERRVSIIDVLERDGVLPTLKGSGNRLRGPCPLHNGSGDEFHVNKAEGLWICFGRCKKGGKSIRYVSIRRGISPREAASWLVREFSLEPPKVEAAIPNQRRTPMANTSHEPAFKVFAASDREVKDPESGELRPWMTRVGTAWRAAGDRISITLDALPLMTTYEGKVQCRLLLTPFTPADAEEEKQSARKAPRR